MGSPKPPNKFIIQHRISHCQSLFVYFSNFPHFAPMQVVTFVQYSVLIFQFLYGNL